MPEIATRGGPRSTPPEMRAAGKSMRERLVERSLMFGSFAIEISSATFADALSQAGFDFLVVDTEHSAFDLSDVSALVLACRAFGIGSIVRVGDMSTGQITRICDLDPDGLMFPGVGDVATAEAAVRASKYAPAGRRGSCPMVRHERLSKSERHSSLNDKLAIVLQLEGIEAVSQAAEIAAVPGVDAVFVGTYDLSQALGVPGQIEHPLVREAGRQIAASLPESTALGVYVQTAAMARWWIDVGATFIAYATDGQLLLKACQRVSQEFLTILAMPKTADAAT